MYVYMLLYVHRVSHSRVCIPCWECGLLIWKSASSAQLCTQVHTYMRSTCVYVFVSCRAKNKVSMLVACLYQFDWLFVYLDVSLIFWSVGREMHEKWPVHGHLLLLTQCWLHTGLEIQCLTALLLQHFKVVYM